MKSEEDGAKISDSIIMAFILEFAWRYDIIRPHILAKEDDTLTLRLV